MEDIEIDIRKSIAENASLYYERAKKAKEKARRLRELLEKGITDEEKKDTEKEQPVNEKRKWYERFRWFYSSKGFLVVAGRNANQNETLYKRVMRDNDLFFHAEIVGAPFTIVKNGVNADEKTLFEAAQFAASYSRAWKFGYTVVDVYSVKKEQLTKKVSGQYVKKGGIIVEGERTWYRNTKLGLAIGLYQGRPACFPELCSHLLAKAVRIVPGSKEKEVLGKEIAARTGISIDEVIALLPNGTSDIVE